MARGMACIGIAASALLSGSAEEGPQQAPDFTGTSVAWFVDPKPVTASVTGVGTDTFTWGQGGGASTLNFQGTAFSRHFGVVFSLGTLTYTNGASTSGVASSVDIQLTIILSSSGISKSFTQNFSLINTPNIDNNPGASADFVFLPSNFPDVVFELEGVSYTLNFIGFGVVTGQGHTESLSKFRVLEGGTASAQLLGSITQACVTEQVDPVREAITKYRNCGEDSPGLLAPNWGRFGPNQTLEADSGDTLQLRCEPLLGIGGAYQLFYTRLGGEPLRVGLCPFQGGCNTAEFYHSGDKNKNGKPDCFMKTTWKSADYDREDIFNSWTNECDPIENLLDWAVLIFNVNSNFLDKKSYKWQYAVGPPVPFEATCGGTAPIPTGALVKSSSMDPPLGPETEAFFDEVIQRMALLPASQVPMGASIAKACDLDGDGDCDAFDALLFDDTVGTCDGHRAYDPRADVDQSGCTDARDRRYLFENDEDKDGVPDGSDNCPATANPGQADWNANGLGDACEVNVMVGDLDNDRDVDRDDLAILLAARNTMALGPADRRDLDGDSKITALDGRKLTLLCTRPACATK